CPLFFSDPLTHDSLVFPLLFPATPTTDIYTLSLHDALPISAPGTDTRARRPDAVAHPRAHGRKPKQPDAGRARVDPGIRRAVRIDRKSTRLNSSHLGISYAVFCLKKKTVK